MKTPQNLVPQTKQKTQPSCEPPLIQAVLNKVKWIQNGKPWNTCPDHLYTPSSDDSSE